MDLQEKNMNLGDLCLLILLVRADLINLKKKLKLVLDFSKRLLELKVYLPPVEYIKLQ